VIVPDNYEPSSTAAIYATGAGDNDVLKTPKATQEDILITATLAVETRALVAVLYQIPNEPCTFHRWPGRLNDTRFCTIISFLA
jgi:hypothetical protein